MKTKILLLFAILLSSCSKENDCNCDKVYYTHKVRLDGVRATWYYEKTYSEKAICQDATGKYVQIEANKYYKIECR